MQTITNTYESEEQAKYAVDYYNKHGFRATRTGVEVRVEAERDQARNDLDRELTTPPHLTSHQLLKVMKAGFENLGDAENAKLVRCLKQIQQERDALKEGAKA